MDCIQSTKDVGDFMRLRAYAKINLGLDILGKRSDGYHEVKMIMQTIQMYDLLEIKKKKTSRRWSEKMPKQKTKELSK